MQKVVYNKKLIFICLTTILLNISAYAEKTNLKDLNNDIKNTDVLIQVTKKKMKEIGDVSFLPDLYFVLADLYHEKGRLIFEELKLKSPQKKIEELDTIALKKAKKMAIESYFRFTENYPKEDRVDKALFNIALSYRELGQIEDMVGIYKKITKEFPKSKYWEESQLRLGDYFFDVKKEFELAIEIYQKILDRDTNEYMALAQYKMGWCYINLNKFPEALQTFESLLVVDKSRIEKTNSVNSEIDIRRDALISMIWPYSEIEKLPADKLNATQFFEKLAHDKVTLIQVLNRLGQRLSLKNRTDQTTQVYARLIEVQYELDGRIKAINQFYEAYKKNKKPFPLQTITEIVLETANELRNASYVSNKDKSNNMGNLEIYSRDFITELNNLALAAKNSDLLNQVSEHYENYLQIFPKNKFSADMRTNLAEVQFILKKYNQAGLNFESIYLKTKNEKILQSAIRSYSESLKRQEILGRLELEESRSGYKSMGIAFIERYPQSSSVADIKFNIAKIYYEERDFDRAIKEFKKYISTYKTTSNAKVATNLILDIYNQREDYDKLIAFGQSVVSDLSSGRGTASEATFSQEISEIVKQSQFRKLEDKVGDPRSRDYAKKMLELGKKYKGSSLGDLASYEAFNSYKKKKDPAVYQAGEELLTKHSDSKYAKEVVAELGQIAIQSGDYGRAADYFEKFISLYPQDPLSQKLILSAAVLRENQGDYEKAIQFYRQMNSPIEKVADLMAKAKKWSELNQYASRFPDSLLKHYYVGLSLQRLGEYSLAGSSFGKVIKLTAANENEKTMVAHSLYLLAQNSLKDFRDLQFGQGDDGAVTKQKAIKLNNLNSVFNDVIQFGSGKWVIGSLYSLGLAHREFSEFLNRAPIPSGLDADVVVAYKQAIATQVGDYKSKSNQYFKSCLENAEKFEIFTLYVKGCQTSGDYKVDDSKEEVIVRKPINKITPEIKKIRTALMDNPNQLKLIIELGQIYIRNKNFGMAKLAMGRVLELQPNHPEALSYLGVIEMHNLDFSAAKNYFSKSLALNSKSELSILGLTALYRKYQFKKIESQMSSRIQFNKAPYAHLHAWIDELL